MDGQISGWDILVISVTIVTGIPVLIQALRKIWNFVSELFSFKNLKILALGRKNYRGIPHIAMKTAFTGKEGIIVEEVTVNSKLSYPRPIEGVLAWLQLVIGYLIDDVEGLNNVLGRSFPTRTWIPTFPFHRISNRYIRKPLNVLLALVVLYYFLVLLIPIFWWPFLFAGPYWELKYFAGNENVRLFDRDSRAEMKRPFIIKTGVEKRFDVSYKPSLYITSILMTKIFVENVKISFVKEPPRIRKIKLPRNNEFNWKVKDNIRIKIRGKMRGYSVKPEVGYANVQPLKNIH